MSRAGLEALDTATSKLVVLYLAHHGPCAVEELRDELGIPLIKLFAVIDVLEGDGLVTATEGTVRLERGRVAAPAAGG